MIDFQKTKIDGVYIAQSKRLGDERGYFMRLFCQDSQARETGVTWQPVQINHSYTQERHTIRGMHFQKAPALEAKIVRCLKGKVLDVVVDLRKGSPTFLQYVSVELSADNNQAFIIPEGCAHGFQSLEDDCALLYLHSAPYSKENESGVLYNDPILRIDWPFEPTVLSERDQSFSLLTPNFKGI